MKNSANRVLQSFSDSFRLFSAAGRWLRQPAALRLVLWLLPAACTVERPPVEQTIGEATGIGEAIVFRHEPEELDPAGGGGGR